MKFISIFWPDQSALAAHPPSEKEFMQMGQLIDEMKRKGVLVDTGGVMAEGTSFRVQRTGAKVSVTDGPFAEAKEVIGGFALLRVQSKDEAISLTRRFLDCAGDGISELHEVSEMP